MAFMWNSAQLQAPYKGGAVCAVGLVQPGRPAFGLGGLRG